MIRVFVAKDSGNILGTRRDDKNIKSNSDYDVVSVPDAEFEPEWNRAVKVDDDWIFEAVVEEAPTEE